MAYRARHAAAESRSRAGKPLWGGTKIVRHKRTGGSYKGKHRETFFSGLGIGRSTWRPLTYKSPSGSRRGFFSDWT